MVQSCVSPAVAHEALSHSKFPVWDILPYVDTSIHKHVHVYKQSASGCRKDIYAHPKWSTHIFLLSITTTVTVVHTVSVRFGLVFPKRSCCPSALRGSRACVGAQYTPVRQHRNSCVSKLVLTAPPLCDGSPCITLLSQILHVWNEASNVYPPTARLGRTNHCCSVGIGNQEEIPVKKLIHTGASERGGMREVQGRSSYSTKQTVLLWEQHEYGNHATDALCWT